MVKEGRKTECKRKDLVSRVRTREVTRHVALVDLVGTSVAHLLHELDLRRDEMPKKEE